MASSKKERQEKLAAKRAAKRSERNAVRGAVTGYLSGASDDVDLPVGSPPPTKGKKGKTYPTDATAPSGTAAPPKGGPIPLSSAGTCRYEIPKSARPYMRVPGVVIADERLLEGLRNDPALEQVANVAALPGIVGRSLAMPDCHWGYGFPVGGVAATRLSDGVVSPGGIGFDINCGVRLLISPLVESDLEKRKDRLADALSRAIPSGIGVRDGLPIDRRDLERVLAEGVHWAVERGYGRSEDLAAIESTGRIPGANPEAVSRRATDRGLNQLGTLGSGNHFFEVQVVDEIYDGQAARAMGLELGRVCVFVHSGSRGLGHQVCQDYLDLMADAMRRYSINLPDRQLACAPIKSPEGQRYLGAMNA